MRSSKLIIKSTKNYGFGCRFDDLEYFDVGCFFMFLEFIIKSRASLHKLIEKHKFNVILSCFKKIMDNCVFDITVLAPSFKICRLFLTFIW